MFSASLRPVTFSALALLFVTSAWTALGDEAKPELHIVSIYEGNTRTGNQIHGERASVRVDRPGKPVVLFLGSYDSVTWTVEATEKTQIRSVILGGREKQAVQGLNDDVKVVNAFGEDRKTALYGYYQIDAAPTRWLIGQLATRVGVAPSSFHGIYRPDSAIEVNAVQDDPRLDPGYPQVASEKFPDTPFTAIHVVDGNHVSVGDFTLKGPKLDTLRPVPDNQRKLTHDPDAKQWYGIHRSLFKLDLARNLKTEVPLDIDAPPLNASAVTFDTKRKRVLVASNGALFAYFVGDEKWSIVGSVNGVGLNHLCYLPDDDMLYDIFLDYDGNSHTIPTLMRLNMHGALIGRQRLKGPFFAGMIGDGHHGGSTQLVPFGDKLVLIATSSSRDSGTGSRIEPVTYIFLIDPKAATAKLTWKSDRNSGTVKTRPAVPAKPDGAARAVKSDREVHAVCLSYGVDRKFANIAVNRPDMRVTLFLSAYGSTEWKVTAGEGTIIERVILGGYESQNVTGLGDDVKIEGGSDERRRLYGGYRVEEPRFRQMLKRLNERTGLELSSCFTAVRLTKPVVIDKVVDDPLLASNYPQPVAADQLPKLRFNAPYVSMGGRYGGHSVSWGEFTQQGPTLSTLKNLPKGVGRLAYDPKQKQFYGLGGAGPTRVNLEQGTATEMDLGMDVPRLSWPSALAFDTKLRRLLLFSRSLIYQCDVDNNHKWTVLCELTATRGSVIQSAAYLAAEDAICVVAQPLRETEPPIMARLSPDGALMRSSPLKRPIFSGIFGRGPGSSSHLITVDDHFVLLVYPNTHDPESPKTDSYMFIIDPKTEEAKLAWRS